MTDIADPNVSVYERNGVTVTRTHRPGGYNGSEDYALVGTFDAITEVVEGIYRSYPPAGYGTWFNWPPGKTNLRGETIEYKKAVEIEPGIWRALGNHSNSCD